MLSRPDIPKWRPTSNKAVKTWSVLENPQWQFDDVPPRQPRRILAALCSRSHISPCPCSLAGIFGHPGFNSQIEIENERRTAIYVRSDENENFQESRCGACVVLVGLLWATEALPLEVLLISPCWATFHFILPLFIVWMFFVWRWPHFCRFYSYRFSESWILGLSARLTLIAECWHLC